MAYQQPPYGAPPPLHHQPYSNPGPTSPEQLPPHQQSAPVPYRSHSDYTRGPGQHHPVPSPEFPYGSSPASHSGFHDSRLAPVPSGQPLPPQPHMLAPPPLGTVPSSQALMPSYAADMPQVYRSNSHGSHYSVPGGRGRSSSHASHTSHRSHKSSHSHTKKEKRPTMGDTLYLMWDSVWNAFSRRK